MENPRLEQLFLFLEKEPHDPFLNYALAMEYIGAENDVKAIDILEKLVENSPEYTGSYYHLGHAYLRLKEKEKAIKIWEQGIEVTRRVKNQHALSELQSALNELLYDDE